MYIIVYMENTSNFETYVILIDKFFRNNSNDKGLKYILSMLELNETDKIIFYRRIMEILTHNKYKTKKYKKLMYISKYSMITLSAIISFTTTIYSFQRLYFLNYINIILMFLLTLITSLYFQSNIHEKYITVKKANIMIINEMWSYIMLINSYNTLTHREALNPFFTNIEKIQNNKEVEFLDLINNEITSHEESKTKL
jgi:hypothetical protein